MNYYVFHLCHSQCEGFGHYINEGLSCGAVVITSDASPMNEIISKDNGILLQPTIHKTQLKVIKCYYSISEIENCITYCLNMSDEEIQKLSINGKITYEQTKKTFNDKIDIIFNYIMNGVK
jgi:hypothetical protein